MSEWLQIVGTWALAIMVTLGLPVLVLFGLGYYLYHRRRWRSLTMDGGRTHLSGDRHGPGGRGQTRRRRCWEIRGCPPEVRNQCPAFWHPEVPCWQALKDALGGRIQSRCLGCGLLLAW